MAENPMETIVALAKRRGFVFQDSEIYGGLANTWSYGPLGTELMRNIRNLWWKTFVTNKPEIYGIETPIIMNPKVWESSGHAKGFADAMIECKNCHQRTGTDRLIENKLPEEKAEGKSNTDLDGIISNHQIHCPNCGEYNWTPSRNFNLLFETHIGIVPESESLAYLRGETAQGMFVNFNQIIDAHHPKLPFGIAQIGKAFRNEITKGNFIFRTLEFEQMEIEYFIDPAQWESTFEEWKQVMWQWLLDLGINPDALRWRAHSKEELAFYSKRTEDIEYKFPFGFKELYGLAYRTDYDLKNHADHSGHTLEYRDPLSKEPLVPHVIEPTFGLNRTFLCLLLDSYREDGDRKWLALNPSIAPYKAAVFPLLKNKPDLVNKAREVFDSLKTTMPIVWDDRGNIGKRYYAQDEIGTPWCITIDFDTLEDETVTIRDRDTTEQQRLRITDLKDHITRTL